jgi:ribosomal protein S18 acetylase RimI-like enzyme
MQIRVITTADVEAFRILRLEAINNSPAAFLQTEESFKATLLADLGSWIEPTENKATLGVFDDAGKLLGMAGFRRDSGPKIDHKAMVWGVFLTPSARGLGVGKKLMQALIEEASRRPDIVLLYLAVAESQIAAKALYESVGFKTYGREPKAVRVDAEFLDEDHMSLDLTEARAICANY